jgi:hypothetical protein
VDFDRYLHDLRLELRRGQRRAAHLRAATLAAARTVSAGDLGAF